MVSQVEAKRLLTAAIYAMTMVAAILGAVGQPVTVKGWIVFVLAALFNGYSKYSDGANIVFPNREPWTEDRRREFTREKE